MRKPVFLCAIAACSLASLSAQAEELARKPYLQQGTPTSVVIAWMTDVAAPSVVHVGAAPGKLDKEIKSDASVTQHEVRVEGLTPGTRYYYDVGSNGVVLAGNDAGHYFVTSPPVATKKKLRAWIVGDSGTGDTIQAAVRDAASAEWGVSPPDLFLHMGDMAYDEGTGNQFTRNFFMPYEEVLKNTVCWPTMGNHEGKSSDSGAQSGPYYTAYSLPKAGEAGGEPSGTEAYYSFDYANAHFLVLDSHDSPREPDGTMMTWAKADLAATTQDWVIAFWHHPPYTKGSHDSDSESQLVEMREWALPILEAGGVDLVLAGHSHIYERSFLVDGAYDTPTTAAGHIVDSGDGKPLGTGPYKKKIGLSSHGGAVYVVAGHGGAGVDGDGNHPLMYFSELDNGSCLLDIQENRLTVINVRRDGEKTDRFDMVKGSPALVIDTPNGAEKLDKGAKTDIRWATVGSVADVKLELSVDRGKTWSVIAASAPNTGAYSWTVPDVDSAYAVVRVSDVTAPQVNDESNAAFAIGEVGTVTVVPFGDIWSYEDTGKDLGDGWTDLSFDDSGWKQGPAELGYGDGDEATQLTEVDPAYPSAYFRKKISLSNEAVAASLSVRHDDGVRVWINGKEVLSQYVDDPSYAAFATQGSDDNELTTAAVPVDAFVVGDNIISAIVKQSSASSSDLSFDLSLSVTFASELLPTGSGGAGGAGAGAGGTNAGGGPQSGGSAGEAGAGETGGSSGGCGCSTAPDSEGGAVGAAMALLALWRRRPRRLKSSG